LNNVLLVCTGNICRSPLAEAMMRKVLADLKAAIEVSSAGTGAWDGASVSEGAYLVGLEKGHDLSDYKATLLTREAVQQADLILTMARHHRARVEELGGAGKTHVLGEYVGRKGDDAEVSDPFGSDLSVYRDTYAELETLIDKAVERLIGSERDPDPR
jgi:protein-tyrosine-phosphatase